MSFTGTSSVQNTGGVPTLQPLTPIRPYLGTGAGQVQSTKTTRATGNQLQRVDLPEIVAFETLISPDADF